MPTVILTSKIDHPAPKPSSGSDNGDPGSLLAWEDLIYLADLSLTGDDRMITLRGGEPTSHPNFLDMLVYLLERGFAVRVFTCGDMESQLLEEMSATLERYSIDRVLFYLDINGFAGDSLSPEKERSARRFMDALGGKTVPTMTLVNARFSLEPIINLINVYNLNRMIHFTTAQPVEGRSDPYLEPEEIEGAVSRIFEFARMLDRFRIKLDLDCTFVPCTFEDEHLAQLMRTTPHFSFTACRPWITIGPDMTAWSCWTLPGFSRRSIFEFDSYPKMQEYFWGHHGAARNEILGAFIDCDTCRMKINDTCSGGCLAHSVKLFASEQPGLRDIALREPIKIEVMTDE